MSQPIIPDGTLIDNRYLIQKLLGQGGLGRTYLAFDTRRFNEACVLKEFAPAGSDEHSLQKSRALFKREAEILYHVQHPQIPNFLACFEGGGRLFLVQEFVDGRTYSDLLKARRKQADVFSEQEVIRWLNNLLPVLDYIHQCGIIHRDISPDNIMLPVNSSLPVLIDFGVGKQVVEASQLGSSADDAEEISYVGKLSLVGKVGYAPHEQMRLGVCSPSSDLYALGVTAVVLLTCRDPSGLMNQYSLQWEWRDRTQVSLEFGAIIDKMLADTPAKRYQTASQVSRDLERLAQTDSSDSTGSINSPVLKTVEPSLSPSTAETLPAQMPAQDTLQSVPQPVIFPTSSLPEISGDIPEQQGNLSAPLTDALPWAFIEQCQIKLAEYIGPMAPMIIDEVLNNHRPSTPAQLIDLLIPEIPSAEEAIAFRQHLLG